MKKKFVVVLAIIMVVLITLLIGCSKANDDDIYIETLKNILLAEKELRNLEIGYDEFTDRTEKYFDKYVTYISEDESLLTYMDENNDLIEYKMKDTIGLSENQLHGLKEEAEQVITKINASVIDYYISEPVKYKDRTILVTKEVVNIDSVKFETYHWFSFAKMDDGLIKVMTTSQIYDLERFNQYTEGKEIIFNQFEEYFD